jgi:hypothetical protein
MSLALRRAVERLRPPRAAIDPLRPNACWVEEEPDGRGGTDATVAILLSVAECPWRCAMCDLWKQTLRQPTPAGAVPRQIAWALEHLGVSAAATIKLYNSGSFFDPHSIPPGDWPEIIELVASFERVVVENHPRLCNERVQRFARRLPARLEVALGVESLQPSLLRRLNKGMNRDDIDRAIASLRNWGVDIRAFLMLRPPWNGDREAIRWTLLTLRHLFGSGVRHASVIPTRAGNGWMEARAADGQFAPPSVAACTECLSAALGMSPRGVVTLDLWDWPPTGACSHCAAARGRVIREMNATQRPLPTVACPVCQDDSMPARLPHSYAAACAGRRPPDSTTPR